MSNISLLLEQAINAHQQNDLTEAKKLYEEILTHQPKHPDARHNIAVMCIQTKRFDEALQILDLLVVDEPNHSQYWLTLIQGAIQTLDEEILINIYKRLDNIKTQIRSNLIKYFFENVFFKKIELHKLLEIKSLIDSGKYLEAKSQITELRLLFPGHLELVDLELSIDYLDGSYGSVLEKYKFFSKLHIKYVPAQYKAALASKELGSINDAKHLFESVLLSEPEHSGALLNLATIQIEEDQYDHALGLLRKIKNNTELINETEFNIALCEFKIGKVQDAKKRVEALLERSKNFYPAYQLLGDILNKDQPQLALQNYRLANSKEYMNSNLACSTILLYLKDKSYSEAKTFLSNISDEFIDIRIVLAGIVISKALNDDAMFKLYKRMTEDFSISNSKQHKDIAYIYFAVEDYVESSLHIEKYLVDFENDVDAVVDLFTAKMNLRKFEDCYFLYSRYEAHISDHPIVIGHMGLVYFYHLLDFPKSIEVFVKSFDHDATAQMAWNNIYFPLRAMLTQGNLTESEFDEFLLGQPDDKKANLKLKVFQGVKSEEQLVTDVKTTLYNYNREKLHAGGFKKRGSAKYDTHIALFNFGRSGTGMFHALIDGHPEVTTLPSVYMSEMFDDLNMKQLLQGGCKEFCKNLRKLYPIFFDTSDPTPMYSRGGRPLVNFAEREGLTNLGQHKNETTSINYETFLRVFDQLTPKSEYSFVELFEVLNTAYEKIVTGSDAKRTLFYHIHNPDKRAFVNFTNAYPKAKLCVLVREPLQSIASWLSKSEDYTEMVTRLSKVVFDVSEPLYCNSNCFGIKLEDIKLNTDQTLKQICDWFGINFSSSMYEMTVQEKKWWGDPQSPYYEIEGVDPFGTAAISASSNSFFSDRDIILLETIFRPFKEKFQYKQHTLNKKQDPKVILKYLDDLFEFERQYIKKQNITETELRRHPMFNILRGNLRMRLNDLLEYGSYPRMLKPLSLDLK
jgi:tetratricopeptide (TPR) repeat protein